MLISMILASKMKNDAPDFQGLTFLTFSQEGH